MAQVDQELVHLSLQVILLGHRVLGLGPELRPRPFALEHRHPIEPPLRAHHARDFSESARASTFGRRTGSPFFAT